MAPKKTSSYDPSRAERFWSRRLASTGPLSAVLTYNAPPELNRAYDEWEKQVLLGYLGHDVRGKRVLDLGAGIGRISLLLAKRGAEVVALDNSRAMLDRLAKAASSMRLTKHVTTVHSESSCLPFDDRSFDFVACFGLLEHLPEKERQRTLGEAVRVVKRTGRILLVVNNIDNPFLTSRYPLKRQERSGYYVTLVGLDWLERSLRGFKMRMQVLADNPGYALVHYLMTPQMRKQQRRPKRMAEMCQTALEMDLKQSLPQRLRRIFASHFIVELRRK